MVMRRRMGNVALLAFHGIRFMLPPLVWVVIFIVKLILTAVVSFFRGVPEATHAIAAEQEARVMQSGKLPTIYARHFYWAVRILAVLVVLFGWICWSFTTVYIVTLIF